MAASSLDNLISLLGNVKGTSSTSTSQSNISAAGMQALLKQAFESNQGLATVAGGQKSAGLYNSTVNQQLTNDLLTRTAGEVAKLSAGTTTTTKTAPKLAPKDILGLVALSGAKNLLGPTISGIGKKLGVDSASDLGNQLASALGLADTVAPTAGAAIDPLVDAGLSSAVDSFGTGSLADLFSNFGSSVASDLGSSVAGDAASSLASDTVDSTATDAFSSFFG